MGLEDEVTEVLAMRLIAQDDEVRLVLGDASGRDRWQGLGIHVAVGDVTDDDFMWRACTNVRTIVAGDAPPLEDPTVRAALAPIVAKTDADRLVVVGPPDDDELARSAPSSGLSHVVLRFRKRSLLGRTRPPEPDQLAAAIDAADDLAGEPRLDLDLSQAASWAELRLAPPD